RLRRKNQAPDLMPRQEGDIPEVSARDSGPRIIVKQFTFDRLEEFPEFKITREGVEAEAERLRVIYMKEDQRREDGYTPEEVNEITGYLKDIGGQSSVDDLTHEDMQALVELVREQNRNRGLSFADLEEIANRLTLYYRERGLFLARVLLPAQEVKDGVVRFTVMEGRLGQLETYGNRKYSDATLKSPLEPLVGGIVTSQEVVESLYIINDLPGLKVTGAFSAGDNPGETRLKLAVREEENFDFMVRLDNHGAAFTGKARIYGNMQWHNPIGFGDRLTLGYMRSEDPGENNADAGLIGADEKPQAYSDLGQIRYSFPIFGLRNRIELAADYNQFNLVDENGGIINALELNGVNENYALRYSRQLVRSRD
ncbi:MAG: POTRA domain-containing protein, partial [Thalassolituus sp.]